MVGSMSVITARKSQRHFSLPISVFLSLDFAVLPLHMSHLGLVTREAHSFHPFGK